MSKPKNKIGCSHCACSKVLKKVGKRMLCPECIYILQKTGKLPAWLKNAYDGTKEFVPFSRLPKRKRSPAKMDFIDKLLGGSI